jgi:ferredoxin-nitrite reductase
MYWSGCVKGCGLHSLGDIGFEGCKAKVDGANEYGVHIFLGGKTSGNSKEGFTVLRAVPLRFAKYYVESLALEYKKLKLRDESFEGFSQRILSNYSRGAIGFMMLLQAYIRKNDLDIEIGFKKDIKTGKNENFEIFDIGRKLYKSLVNEEPYLQYETFSPNATSKFKKIKDLSLDQNFINLIHEMLDKTNQAQVFSQIQHFVEYKA